MRFRVLSYNVYKFGGPVPAEVVVERILALDPQPDILGFQEVFNTPLKLPGVPRGRNAKKILEESLQEAGYETCWLATGGPPFPLGVVTAGRFRDGLLAAVKKEIWSFDPASDYFSFLLRKRRPDRRGLQCLVLREKDVQGRRVAFFNTHLTVGTKDKKREIRARQVERLLEHVASIESTQHPICEVVVGDFNALEGQPEIMRLTDPETGFEDTFRRRNAGDEGFSLDRESNTIVARRPQRGQEEASRRIDYVLVRPGSDGEPPPPVIAQSSRVVLKERHPDEESGESLSDHYGVVTEFELAE